MHCPAPNRNKLSRRRSVRMRRTTGGDRGIKNQCRPDRVPAKSCVSCHFFFVTRFVPRSQALSADILFTSACHEDRDAMRSDGQQCGSVTFCASTLFAFFSSNFHSHAFLVFC